MSHFIGDLDVRLVGGDVEGHPLWQLISDFGFHSDEMGMDIIVRKGEHTDFASIPRAPILYLAEGDKGHKASVIHDHLYQEEPHTMNRLCADRVLREALIVEGFSRDEAQDWFLAVRFGGAGHWDANISVAAVSPSVPQASPGS